MLIWLTIQYLVPVAIVYFMTAKVFRRPIELPGLAVCILGILVAGVGHHRAAMMWLEGHTVAWLEGVSSVLFWQCAFLAPAFVHLYVIRRWCSPGPIILSLLLPTVFGVVTGYFYAQVHEGYQARMFYTDWRAAFLLAAAPGDDITNIVAHGGADWQGGEMEFFADKIACWNGLVWLLNPIVIALPVYLLTKRHWGAVFQGASDHAATAA